MKSISNVLIVEENRSSNDWLKNAVQCALPSTTIFQAVTHDQMETIMYKHKIDMAILNIDLPNNSDLNILKYIKLSHPTVFCIMVTINKNEKHVLDAFKAGADGYLLKDSPPYEIVTLLHGVANNKPPITPDIFKMILKFLKKSPENAIEEDIFLSDREQEVLTLVGKSYQRREIAKLLSISPNTVACHIKNIYSKLGISSKADAALEAYKRGLIRT